MEPKYYKTKCRLCKLYKMTKSGFSYCFECWEKSRRKDPEDVIAEKKAAKAASKKKTVKRAKSSSAASKKPVKPKAERKLKSEEF